MNCWLALKEANVRREEGMVVGTVGFHSAQESGPCFVARGPSLRDGIESNPAQPALPFESAACGRLLKNRPGATGHGLMRHGLRKIFFPAMILCGAEFRI